MQIFCARQNTHSDMLSVMVMTSIDVIVNENVHKNAYFYQAVFFCFLDYEEFVGDFVSGVHFG